MHCFNLAVTPEAAKNESIAYYVEDDLLLRKWSLPVLAGKDWGVVTQVVVPTLFRHQCVAVVPTKLLGLDTWDHKNVQQGVEPFFCGLN